MPNLRGASPVGCDGGKAVRTQHRRTAEIDQIGDVSVTAESWARAVGCARKSALA